MARSLLAFPSGSVVKNPPAVQEIRVCSLGGEDPLEKEQANHSSILAWEISGTEEPGGLQSMGSQNSHTGLSDETARTNFFFSVAKRRSNSNTILNQIH